jgi:hypothetical protein
MSNNPVNKKNENEPMELTDSIGGVLDSLLGAFSIPEEPVLPLPPLAILTGAPRRPGLDKNKIYSEIISEITEQCGILTGDVFADGPNANDEMILLIVEKVIEAIHLDSVVNVVIPGGIPVQVLGSNGGGIMLAKGATTGLGIGNGIIR